MPTMSRKFQKTATGRNAALCQKDFEVRAESHDGMLPSNVMLRDKSAHARFRELKKLSTAFPIRIPQAFREFKNNKLTDATVWLYPSFDM